MVRFVVTGFSNFVGVPDNPTERLVEMLEQRGPGSSVAGSPAYSIFGTAVLEVAAQPAREWLAQLYASPELAAAAAECPVVLLHLGVDARALGFKLEQQAVNDATFRVPDQRGWQPTGQLIDDRPGCTLNTHLKTDLDVGQLAAQLAGQQGHNVAVSRDAGRFVCNFTYYLSLLHSQTARQLRGAPLHALFVHVPPTTVAPLDQQFAFLLDVLAAVAAALTPAISSTYVGKYLASQAAVHIAAERAVDEHGKDPFQAVAADAAAANVAEATEASA
ncbi:hypothetical protein ABPG77_009276 [Micractinium sp. CCAP 211/92]